MSDFQPHVTVATIIKKDDLFLMVEEYSGGKRVITQPAGHVEDKETLVAAAIRETLEETGWHCEITDFINITQWVHPRSKETYLRFTFGAEAKHHDTTQPLDENIIQALWLSYDEIKSRTENLRTPAVLHSIEDYLADKRYPLNIIADF